MKRKEIKELHQKAPAELQKLLKETRAKIRQLTVERIKTQDKNVRQSVVGRVR